MNNAATIAPAAVISECGQYRYLLRRVCQDSLTERGPVVFVMLNPSTADATQDDPTIRRCRGFAKAWGCRSLIVANLYALRATDPRKLWEHPDPVGPDNDAWLRHLAEEPETMIVCAWGSNAKPERMATVAEIFAGCRLWCLGTTKAGMPKHPLYIRADQELLLWTPPIPGIANSRQEGQKP